MKNFPFGQPSAGWIGQKPAGSHVYIHINQRLSFYTASEQGVSGRVHNVPDTAFIL
jgi:hypothetical protein